MSNVLSTDKQQQVVGLGRLGCTLRRIERETGVRRETVSGYLKAAGVVVRGRGGRAGGSPAEPATLDGVSTETETSKPATSVEVSTDPLGAKPATLAGVSTN